MDDLLLLCLVRMLCVVGSGDLESFLVAGGRVYGWAAGWGHKTVGLAPGWDHKLLAVVAIVWSRRV